MGHTIMFATVGAVAFMVLDGIWLGVLTNVRMAAR